MFRKETILQLLEDKNNFECIQKEAADLKSPNHWQAMLKLGLYKIHTSTIHDNLIDGFDKICEVVLSDQAHSENAYNALDFADLLDAPLKLKLIFRHYNEMPEKTGHDQTILGLCHEKGIGTPINSEKAKQCYQLAKLKGYVQAEAMLAVYMSEEPSVSEQKDAPERNETLLPQYKKETSKILYQKRSGPTIAYVDTLPPLKQTAVPIEQTSSSLAQQKKATACCRIL